jgi:hypothetical protein
MVRLMCVALGLAMLAGTCGAAEFEPPTRLKAGDKFIRVESPGYACPAWADVDGDGKPELVVGQFAQGKMKLFKHLGNLKFEEGEWLKADGKVAQVEGVW